MNNATDAATGAFTVSDVQLLCTQYEIDNASQELIHDDLLSGKTLSIPLECWFNSSQALASGAEKIHVGANKARLNKALVIFKATADVEVRYLRIPASTLELDVNLGSKRVPERTMTSVADF